MTITKTDYKSRYKSMTTAQLQGRAAELKHTLASPAFNGDVDALIEEAEALSEILGARSTNAAAATLMGFPAPEDGGYEFAPVGAVTSRVVDSDEFKALVTRGGRGTATVHMPGVSIRALTSLPTSAGAFQNPPHQPEVPQTNADRFATVTSLLPHRTATTGNVEWVEDTSGAGGGSAAETAEGAVKPETTYTFELKTTKIATVAHWLQITRQALDDAPELNQYVQGRMRYGLAHRIDGAVLNGNGVDPNMRGILQTTGVNTYAPGVAEARIITIRKAMTTVHVDEYQATGVVLHPTDWELIELSTDSNGQFRVTPTATNALAPRIWGANAAITTTIAAGTGLVGDFQLGAAMFDRMQPTVIITDSHASTFTSNILTMLCEARGTVVVLRPSAFCKITFNGIT